MCITKVHIAAGAICALGLASASASCKDLAENTYGFRCGYPLRNDPSSVHTCSEPDEICVCATQSCAAPVSESICLSRYQYSDEPFATRPGACVNKSDVDNIIAAENAGAKCPVGAEGEGGGGASGGGGAQGTGAGTGTGGTAGAGGQGS